MGRILIITCFYGEGNSTCGEAKCKENLTTGLIKELKSANKLSCRGVDKGEKIQNMISQKERSWANHSSRGVDEWDKGGEAEGRSLGQGENDWTPQTLQTINTEPEKLTKTTSYQHPCSHNGNNKYITHNTEACLTALTRTYFLNFNIKVTVKVETLFQKLIFCDS